MSKIVWDFSIIQVNTILFFDTQLGDWFGRVFAHLVRLPRYLIPCYFDAIVTGVYMLVEEVAWAKMHKSVINMCVVHMCG